MAEPSSGRRRPTQSAVAPSLAVGRLVHSFESALWGSRLLVLVAVIVVLVLAVTALVLAAADAAYLVGKLAHFVGGGLSGQARNQRRTELITTVVKALDNCLIGALLIVVSLGLYELFISRIEPARESPAAASRLLRIHDLEDLKQRVGKLVVLVLAVQFFQQALTLPVANELDLLYLGVGVLLVSAALYLSGQHGRAGNGDAGAAGGPPPAPDLAPGTAARDAAVPTGPGTTADRPPDGRQRG